MLDRFVSEILEELNQNAPYWARRFNPILGYNRQENNIFSLASALFIFTENRSLFPISLKPKIEQIEKQIKAKFPFYQNKDGRATYNFYKTRPSQHFPNGYLMQYWDHFRLPDDIDDTALIYYTLQPSLEKVKHLKEITETFAQDFNTGIRIYSTWYGKNMPKEQDLCALLNLLYLFEAYKLPHTSTDIHTYNYLIRCFDEIENSPFQLARHYGNPTLIYYHYARFISKFSSPLDNLTNKLIEKLLHHSELNSGHLNQILIESSLLKLGQQRNKLDVSALSRQNFYTFIGAPFAPFTNKLSKWLAPQPLCQMFWEAPIHTKALIIEYLLHA